MYVVITNREFFHVVKSMECQKEVVFLIYVYRDASLALGMTNLRLRFSSFISGFLDYLCGYPAFEIPDVVLVMLISVVGKDGPRLPVRRHTNKIFGLGKVFIT